MLENTRWLDEQAELTLSRLLPRLEPVLSGKADRDLFLSRLNAYFDDAFDTFFQLYSGSYDFFYHLEQMLLAVAENFNERSDELKTLDTEREASPEWFQSETMIGALCEAEQLAGDSEMVSERIAYFEEIGLTYLHVRFDAQSRFDELAGLTSELRQHGISLALDFWLDESTLGSAEGFRATLNVILRLANQGMECLRLDWSSELSDTGRTQMMIRSLNAFVRMACPALLFSLGAVVHPHDLRSLIDAKACPLGDNSILMTAIWEALATRNIEFFRRVMNKRLAVPPGCAWINFLHTQDEMRWSFADEDAAEMGLNPVDHCYFLDLFYLGRFPGSFADGLPVDFDPHTQDMGIAGATASLAGLERAQAVNDAAYADTAIRRITMIYSVVLSVGGIPLLYLGDEVGTINDYRFRADTAKAGDNRWANRPALDADKLARRHDSTTDEGKLFQALTHLIELRRRSPALANGEAYFIYTGNASVLGYTRHQSFLILANFSEHPQYLDVHTLQNEWAAVRSAIDLISGTGIPSGDSLKLGPYQFLWLARQA